MNWPGPELAGEAGVPDWDEHQARAGDLAEAVCTRAPRGRGPLLGDRHWQRDWAAAVRAAPGDVWASLLLLLLRRAAAEGDCDQEVFHLLQILGRRRCRVPARDAAYALTAAAALDDSWISGVAAASAAALAAHATQPSDPGLQAAAARLTDSVHSRRAMSPAARGATMRSLTALKPLPGGGGPLDTSAIAPADGWSAALLGELANWTGASEPASLLLRHLASAAGSRPTRKWLAHAGELTGDPAARRLLRLLLETAVTAEGVTTPMSWLGQVNLLVSDRNADLLRATAWAVATVDEAWVVPALHGLARRSISGTALSGYVESPRIPNACIYSLGTLATTASIACLLELQRTTRHAGYRTRIGAALAAASQQAGLSPSALAERVIPDAGLDRGGERSAEAGGVTARIRIGADWRVITEWQTPDGWSRKAPGGAAAVSGHPGKQAASEARTAVAGERNRLEGLLATGRAWALDEWQRLYLRHPVTGRLARALIWDIQLPSGEHLTGMPAGDGQLRGPGGGRPLPSQALVRLWHPAQAATAEVVTWRDYLAAEAEPQPFRQAFREVYLLTPAERETRLYSNRFAAHILHYRQAYALFKERHWTANFLGPYDGGYEGYARSEFPDAGLTAVFCHYPAEDTTDVTLCSSGRVSFYRTRDRRRAPVPLADVPPLVFTEAMRDVDLFISVTSIGLDPQWADHGDDPHHAYWREYSFGDLSQTAAMRRDVLARLVPKLKIAGQLELTGRYLRVRGRRNNYRIHIGSGNILIEPDDRYLCVVPRAGHTRVMLPFEGDQLLSVILSKAVLLAADDKISDPAILAQLGPGR